MIRHDVLHYCLLSNSPDTCRCAETELIVGRLAYFEGITWTVGKVPLKAVPLLLAAAKAADSIHVNINGKRMLGIDPEGNETGDALAALDVAHPEWRSW